VRSDLVLGCVIGLGFDMRDWVLDCVIGLSFGLRHQIEFWIVISDELHWFFLPEVSFLVYL
jgi:hypothetical protein